MSILNIKLMPLSLNSKYEIQKLVSQKEIVKSICRVYQNSSNTWELKMLHFFLFIPIYV